MALKNPKLFGLNVRTLLADVENKNTALQNLGLNPLDLEVIKGSTNAGMSRFDWISFSRLKNPLYRTLDRFSNESTTFNGILQNRAGTDQTLFGNLDINGSLSGSAIRYRYRVGSGATSAINAITATTSGTYTGGKYFNIFAAESVQVTVTKDASATSSISIFGHTFSTNDTGTKTRLFCVQTVYPVTFNGVAVARINSSNDKILETEDTGGSGSDNDFNDLVLTVNKGRFFESGGLFFYTLDIENEITGNGKATFDVDVDSDGNPTVKVGSDKGDGNSVGDTLTLLASQVGGSGSSQNITVTVNSTTTDPFRAAIADISTSRVSAWSSADPRANDPLPDTQKLARISYGARVGIVEGGKLEFGTQSTVSNFTYDGVSYTGPAGQPRLQTTITPEEKEFPSEVPTSIIKCKIGNEIVKLYAMKGIPLVFKSFFRSLNATVTVNTTGTKKKASWKIVETQNENLFTNYTNQGDSTSSISYRSPISRERFIKLYKNPNEIFSIDIRSANLRELPATQLTACTSLEFSYNQLKTFPNFSFIAPNLKTLLIRRNPFYLSDIETERTFNSSVLAKIPTTLNNLHMEGTFYGSIERNIISARLPDLVTFDCARGGGAYFHRDTRSPDGNDAFCPDVPQNVTTYNIGSNDFRSVDNNEISPNGTYANGSFSYKKLTKLVNLSVSSNYHLSDGSHSLASDSTISTINYSGTGVGLPNNLGGKSNLTSFVSTHNRGSANQLVNASGNYLFGGCGSLKTLHLYNTNLGSINFPSAFNNPSLTYLDLRYTNIVGGAPVSPSQQTHVITEDTFKGSTELQYIMIDSRNLGAGFPSGKNIIHEDAFQSNTELYYIWYRSYSATTGEISQLFNANSKLAYVWMESNKFTGTIPNFVGNPLIYYVNLQYNQLSGSIPGFKNLNSLHFLYLQNNNLTGISEPDLLPNLRTYQAPNNQIAGQIPDFTGCPRLRSLTLRNNQLSSYKPGAFAKLYQVNFIDLKFNNLTQTDLDNILIDLHTNWTTYERSGVSINLKNQTNNGVIVDPTEAGYKKARILVANGWIIGLSNAIPDEPEF